MSAIDGLKRFYWEALHELRAYRSHLLWHIPGRVGVAIRLRHFRSHIQSCGDDVAVMLNVRVLSGDRLRIGSRVTVDRDCYLNASGGIDIGDDCYVGPDTKIWTDNHVFSDPALPFIDQGATYKPVSIERDVWIGPRCFIKPGSTVKTGAVLMPGTVLAKSVPPFAIVQGNPGLIVGWRRPRG